MGHHQAAGAGIAAGRASEFAFSEATRAGLELIRRIYVATVGESGWQPVADAMSVALDGAVVVFSLRLPTDTALQHLIVAGGEMEPAARQADALLAAAARSAGTLHQLTQEFATVEMEPAVPNLIHLPGVERGQPIASIITYRTPGDGEFDREERQLVERLTSHFDRAFVLSQKHLRVAQQSTALAEIMDRLASGILLLDDAGEVVLNNRAARLILARSDGFAVAGGRLRVDDPDTNETLQARIGEAIAIDAPADAGGILVAKRPSGAAAYPVSVMRLLPGHSNHDVVACVLVSDPECSLEPAIDLMRSLHELTRAEAELVGQLARGHTIEAAAQARGVSVNTMRSHLKHVFQKTGTSRQGELVQLVLRSFVPVGEE